MANNITVNGKSVGTQDVSGVHFQKTKATGTTVATVAVASVTTTSAIKVPANTERQTVLILNTGTVDFEIAPSSVAYGSGITVAAGGQVVTQYQGAIYARTSSGTSELRYWDDANA